MAEELKSPQAGTMVRREALQLALAAGAIAATVARSAAAA